MLGKKLEWICYEVLYIWEKVAYAPILLLKIALTTEWGVNKWVQMLFNTFMYMLTRVPWITMYSYILILSLSLLYSLSLSLSHCANVFSFQIIIMVFQRPKDDKISATAKCA